MKKIALLFAFMAIFVLVTDAGAIKNQNVKYALHYAGPHDAKANTCDFTVADCNNLVVDGPTIPSGEHMDIYVVAIDMEGIAGVRYGIDCVGGLHGETIIYFYGWTKCCDLEIPTVPPDYVEWPNCGAGNAQTWSAEQPGPNLVMGIFECYAYGDTESMSTTTDPRETFAEVCDGTQPSPICFKFSSLPHFGTVGFNGTPGINNCSIIPTMNATWGTVKALYR